MGLTYNDVVDVPSPIDVTPLAVPSPERASPCNSPLIIPINSTLHSNLDNSEFPNYACAECNNGTSGVHSCPRCKRFVHIPCGIQEGEEGYGSSVWCRSCFLIERNIKTQNLRKGIKRNQEKMHERMLKASNKKFKPAEIGETVLIPISQPDKMSSIGPRNIIGRITKEQDSLYTIATTHGTISTGFTQEISFTFVQLALTIHLNHFLLPVLLKQRQCRENHLELVLLHVAVSIVKPLDVLARSQGETVTPSVTKVALASTNLQCSQSEPPLSFRSSLTPILYHFLDITVGFKTTCYILYF